MRHDFPRLCAVSLAVLTACVPLGAHSQGAPEDRGLVLWLKADAGLATDGSVWADQSSRANDFVALPGQAPTYVADGLNGLPVARFSGHQVLSMTDHFVKSQQFTIMAVATDTSSSNLGGWREIISNWSPHDGEQSIFLGTVWSTVHGERVDRIRFTDDIGGGFQGQGGQGRIPDPATAFILTGNSGAADACIYLGLKKEYCLGAPLSTRDLTHAWTIGRQGAKFNSEYWIGDIAEVLVYNRALTTAQRNANITYLAGKWGVALQ